MYFSSLDPTLENKEIYLEVYLVASAIQPQGIWFLSREYSLSGEKPS